MKKLIVIVTILMILHGCASSSISEDYRFNDLSKKGLVVGSISYDGYYAGYNISIKKAGEDWRDYYEVIGTGSGLLPVNLSGSNGNLSHLGVKGDLFAVEMNPGDYELYTWSVDSGTQLGSRRPFSIKFKLKKGKAFYLGNINFKQTDSFGLSVTGVNVKLKSEYLRDSKEFYSRYRNINIKLDNNDLDKGEALFLGSDSNTTLKEILDVAEGENFQYLLLLGDEKKIFNKLIVDNILNGIESSIK